MSGAGTDRIDVPGCGRPIAPELRSGEPQSLQAPDAQTPAPRSDCLRPHSSRAGKKPPAPLSSSGSAERLWSKDQAASRLRHRRTVGRLSAKKAMRLKLVSVLNRFRCVVVVDRNQR
jgi:hypothetical protein